MERRGADIRQAATRRAVTASCLEISEAGDYVPDHASCAVQLDSVPNVLSRSNITLFRDHSTAVLLSASCRIGRNRATLAVICTHESRTTSLPSYAAPGTLPFSQNPAAMSITTLKTMSMFCISADAAPSLSVLWDPLQSRSPCYAS